MNIQKINNSKKNKHKKSFTQPQTQSTKVTQEHSDSDNSLDGKTSELISQRISEILKKDTRESKETVICYIINIISLILVMLVYYGLVVIILIGLLIYWYDMSYNQQDEAFGENSPFSSNYMAEFKTEEEIKASDSINSGLHQDHNHWITPFDFSKVQISVWFAMIPATLFIYMNMAVLKMDNHIEYVYFKKENGIKKLKCLKIWSWM